MKFVNFLSVVIYLYTVINCLVEKDIFKMFFCTYCTIFTIKKIRHLTGFLLPLNLIPTQSYSKTMKIIVHNFSMIFSMIFKKHF